MFHAKPALPPGIVAANGRLEADQIDIATKFAGRVAQLFVDEGHMVKAGQIVATMDTRDLAAALKKAQSLADQAQQVLSEAQANVAQQQTQVTLAKQELDRTAALAPRGFATVELLDQRRQKVSAATAALNAANARVAVAEHALDAAQHDIELYQVNIADNSLIAPRDGRIEYRVANIGEVLPAGGKVFTMLDTGYVYMDVYLPTLDAGRIKLGSEARIVLDAYPAHPIAAYVVFLAQHAQFTPKAVETKDERDKLMFRLRVRVDPDRLRERADAVRSGLPGMTYLRTDPNVPWPPTPAAVCCAAAPAGEWLGRRWRSGVRARSPGWRASPKSIARSAALDGVSLSLPAGILVGLIGPDGVGKSSLLSILAGARQIQSGEVYALGGDMRDASHRAKVCPRIAYMPQGLGKNLYPDLSVQENIAFFSRLSGNPARAAISHRRAARRHRARTVRRPGGDQAVGGHEAEARSVLRPNPRSPSPHP